MQVKAIRTDADYRTALRQVSALIDPPDPIEAIRFRMDHSGMGIPAEVLINQAEEKMAMATA